MVWLAFDLTDSSTFQWKSDLTLVCLVSDSSFAPFWDQGVLQIGLYEAYVRLMIYSSLFTVSWDLILQGLYLIPTQMELLDQH